MIPKSRLPRWCVRDGRNQTRRKSRVICTLPRAQRTRCFHSAVTVSGSSASTTAAGSNTTRRPFSCVRKVVYVSSASVEVSTWPADRLEVLARVQLRAAREARHRAHDVLRAPGGGLRGHVLVADEPRDAARPAAALADERRDGPDLLVGEVPGHAAQRVRAVDDVGVHDEQRLHPVVGQGVPDAVVEGVRLALPALLAAQVHDAVVVLRRLGADHVGGVVGARVVDDEHLAAGPAGTRRPISRSSDAASTAPSFQAGTMTTTRGRCGAASAQVVAERVHRDEQVLVEPGEHRDRADADEGDEDRDEDVLTDARSSAHPVVHADVGGLVRVGGRDEQHARRRAAGRRPAGRGSATSR